MLRPQHAILYSDCLPGLCWCCSYQLGCYFLGSYSSFNTQLYASSTAHYSILWLSSWSLLMLFLPLGMLFLRILFILQHPTQMWPPWRLSLLTSDRRHHSLPYFSRGHHLILAMTLFHSVQLTPPRSTTPTRWRARRRALNCPPWNLHPCCWLSW